jgi:hypothetical protein
MSGGTPSPILCPELRLHFYQPIPIRNFFTRSLKLCEQYFIKRDIFDCSLELDFLRGGIA